jgi:hypothetical protein
MYYFSLEEGCIPRIFLMGRKLIQGRKGFPQKGHFSRKEGSYDRNKSSFHGKKATSPVSMSHHGKNHF